MIGGNLVTRSLVGNRVVGGTWTAITAWTPPAYTLGGTVTLNGQVFDAGAGDAQINTTGSLKGLVLQNTTDGVEGVRIGIHHSSPSPAAEDIIGQFRWQGKDSAANDQFYGSIRCYIVDPTSGAEISRFEWWLYQTIGANQVMTLSGAGALWTDLSVDTLTYKVSGTQVVGARVVDARADDVVDATYGAEEAGVLDALRDAMIAHGLIAAA